MKPIDKLFQEAVDKEADKIIMLSVADFLKIDDFGRIESATTENKIPIAWWHHKLDENLHHIVFQSERRYGLIFTKKYLSGIKLEDGKLLKLNDIELGQYD